MSFAPFEIPKKLIGKTDEEAEDFAKQHGCFTYTCFFQGTKTVIPLVSDVGYGRILLVLNQHFRVVGAKLDGRAWVGEPPAFFKKKDENEIVPGRSEGSSGSELDSLPERRGSDSDSLDKPGHAGIL